MPEMTTDVAGAIAANGLLNSVSADRAARTRRSCKRVSKTWTKSKLLLLYSICCRAGVCLLFRLFEIISARF